MKIAFLTPRRRRVALPHCSSALFALVLGGLALPTALAAQEAASGAQMPLSQFAPATLRQDMFKGVYEVIELPGRNQIAVAASPSFEAGTSGYLDLLDADDLSPVRRLELPRRSFALGLDAERGRIYVGNTLDGALTVLDLHSGLILETVQLGKPEGTGFEHTRMIAVDDVTGRVLVTSPSPAGTVWIIDPENGYSVQRLDDAGMWAAGLAVDSARGRAYSTGGGMQEVLVLDVKTGERLGTFSTGDTTTSQKEESAHFFVNAALDSSGARLFAVDADTGSLFTFDTESGAVINKAPIGLGALDVVYAPTFDRIFVTYRGVSQEQPEGSGGVVVLNAQDYSRVADIPLPVHPNSLALGAAGEVLYVTVKAPMEETHPQHRAGAADSVLRIDLKAVPGLTTAP